MGSWVKEIFQELLLLILKLIDGVSQMFNLLLGLEQVEYKGENGVAESVSLVDFFLEQETVVQIFLVLFVVSVVLLAVVCIFAIFKSMFFTGNGDQKTPTRVVGDGLKSLLTTLLAAVVTVTAIGAANTMLVVVNDTFKGEKNVTISRVVLELGLQDGTVTDWGTMEYVRYYQINGTLDNASTENINENYDEIDEIRNHLRPKDKDGNGNIWDTENETWLWFITMQSTGGGIINQNLLDELFTESGYLRSNVSAEEIWGTYTTNWVGLPDGGWQNDGALNGQTYNALMPYIAAFILLYILMMTSFQLVKRLYDIITLLLVLPLVNATTPLDDGAHMKLWRETMISKVVIAYGAVFSLGVFMILAPICNNVYIAENTTLTGVLRLILVVGAGLSINGGMLLFSRLVGTGIAESNDMAQTAQALLAGGAGALFTAGQALKKGKNLLLGNKQAGTSLGQKGLLGTTLGVADKGMKVLGGNAYQGAKTKTAEKIKGALSGTKQWVMNHNGILGAPFTRKGGKGEGQ